MPDPHAAPALVAESVTAAYRKRVVLSGISFRAPTGSVSAVVGLNGAGKSTLLRVMAGLTRPASGRVLIGGVDVQGRGHADVALVLQKLAIDRQLTGAEYLRFAARARGIPKAAARASVGAVAADLDLTALLGRRGGQLSGGQARRLQLAGGLVRRPRVLLLDEPTTGLDPDARSRYWKLIRRLASDGMTVIMVTHYIDEAKFADSVLILGDGTAVSSGRPDDLVGQAALSVIELECASPEDAIALQGALQTLRAERTGHVVAITSADASGALTEAQRLSAGISAEIRVRPATFDDLLVHLSKQLAGRLDA